MSFPAPTGHVLTTPAGIKASADNIHCPASNTAAIVTYAAVAGFCHVISGFSCSFDGVLASALTLTIEDGAGNVVFSIDLTGSGAANHVFAFPIKGSVNIAMIITMPAGGSGITGKLNIHNHWMEGA